MMASAQVRSDDDIPVNESILIDQVPTHRPYAAERPIHSAMDISADVDFPSRFFDVGSARQLTGFQPLWMHFFDTGYASEAAKERPTIVMLHGNPTWAYFYRELITTLRSDYRCIAVDHMGCGMSDRPQHFDYTLTEHSANLRALVDTLQLDRVVLVMHDWGGMIGSTWAVDHVDNIEGLVILNTAAFLGKLPMRIRTALIPVIGPAAVLKGNAFLEAALRMCTEKPLSDDVKNALKAPYSTPHDRIAHLRFVEDVPLNAKHPTWNVVERTDGKLAGLKDKPMCVVWGEHDWCFDEAFLQGWQTRFPSAHVHRLPNAGHFTLEDGGQEALDVIEGFLKKNVGE